MPEQIYVIGHKSPDLDSVASAIAYAQFKNTVEQTEKYIPAVAGAINKETQFALEKFGYQTPMLLEKVEGKKLILVDHNEFSQSPAGIENAEIVEVLDHHKVNFSYSQPIRFCVFPWGATCTIIARLFKDKSMVPPKPLAGLMLSAILVDTVITKSPTCTDIDVNTILSLAQVAQIDDWRAFGMELFKIRASVSQLSAAEIIKSDFKDFNFKAGKVGIGQVETVDLIEFKPREAELLKALEKMRVEENYHTVILFITDILKEGSLFLVSTTDKAKVAKALGAQLENGKVYLEGIISRKKQVAPRFLEVFDK